MAGSVRLPIYSLALGVLVVLYAYWEAALNTPIFLLVGVHCVFAISLFAIAHPNVRVARKFTVCFSITFGDSIFTSNMLGTPLSPWFSYLVFEYVAIFVVLQRLHPREKSSEMSIPMVRGTIYLIDGFFMAVGVAQGMEKAMETEGNVGIWTLAFGAWIVIGKNVLTSLIFLIDEFFCESKPVREIRLDNFLFNLKAGVFIFLLLATVWHFSPKTRSEFTWCTYVSNIVYVMWGALDTVAHQQFYSKIE